MNPSMPKHLPIVLLLAACTATQQAHPQSPTTLPGPQVRSLTGALPSAPTKDGFSFLVGGHLYGNPGALSAVPAPTLLTQIHAIRNSPDQFIISTGDLIRSFSPTMIVPTMELSRFLEKPIFNAPGNHDYVPGEYEKVFGPSFGSFQYGNALFVLLNTERQPWHFDDDQIEMVKSTADWVLRQPDIHHVFYFAHKVVFAVEEPRYASLLRNCNGRDGLDGTSNFGSAVLPTLRQVAAEKRVLWFSGDLGVPWSFSLFCDYHKDHGITYLGCGLGGTESDCMLRVCVAGKSLNIDPVPMHAGATTMNGLRIDKPVTHYGPDFWNQHFKKRASERLPTIDDGK